MKTAAVRTLKSNYMNFAKLRTQARFNLAASGILDCNLADLGIAMSGIELHGSNAYGYQPLMAGLAERFGIDSSCVVTAGGGASFANHLAMAALIAPGDEVLVEEPTYELLMSTLNYLGAKVCRVQRTIEREWRLDPELIAERLTPRTRVVVITNLHNPSSNLTSYETIMAVAKIAARVGAVVLVDEVYLELTFADGIARTSFAPDGNVIVTSSLTKAYGLSGLRCGWILAPPVLAERMRRLNDIYASQAPYIMEQIAAAALDRLPQLRARARAMLDINYTSYRELLGQHPALEQVTFGIGTTVFPRLRRGDGDSLYERLMSRFETSIVPGSFFDRPDHIRIGLCGEPGQTRAGLERLAEALSEPV